MFLNTMIARRLRRDDSGAALVTVIAAMLLGVVVVATVAALSVNTTRFTVNQNSLVQANAAAEAGRDSVLATLVASGCTTTSGAGVVDAATGQNYSWSIYASTAASADAATTDLTSPACPTSTTTFVVVHSTGTAKDGTTRTINSAFSWSPVSSANTIGMISTSGALSISSGSQTINNSGGDITVGSGDYTCAVSGQVVDGSVYVVNGNAYLTNSCSVAGDVYASGYVNLDSNTRIGGDVYAGGNVTMNNNSKIGGSISAKGNIVVNNSATVAGSVSGLGTFTLQSGTVSGAVSVAGALSINSGVVRGSVTSSSTAPAGIYAGTIGSDTSSADLTIAGYFSQFQASKVYGNVAAASSTQSSVAPDTTITGNLALLTSPNTWNSGPSVNGTKTYNSAPFTVAAPSVTTPARISAGFTWIDYAFTQTTWVNSGYGVVKLTGTCNYQGDASFVAQLAGYSSPTVLDARDCTDLKFYGLAMKIKTNVSIILPQKNYEVSFQGASVTASDGAAHIFNIIRPDPVADNSPTCTYRHTTSLYSFVMGSTISGFVYDPCGVFVGQGHVINGQIYASGVSFGGGDGQLNFTLVTVPGLITGTGSGSSGSGSSGGTLGTTVLAQRQVH